MIADRMLGVAVTPYERRRAVQIWNHKPVGMFFRCLRARRSIIRREVR